MNRRCHLYENFSWAYDDALTWMEGRATEVQASGDMWLGLGSHSESVLTLGRHAPREQIHAPEEWESSGGLIRRISRGGGATAHNPGQLVLYPVFSLPRIQMDVPRFTFALEESVIRLLADLGLHGERQADAPGVFVGHKKIASLGFRVQHGVTTHGLAINCCNDVSIFREISACGVPNAPVTSIEHLLPQRSVVLEEIGHQLCANLFEICVLR